MYDKLNNILSLHDQTCQINESNSKQSIFKVPKYILISKIVSFLDGEGIVSFGYTCKTFNMMIYNPYTFTVLLANISSSGTTQNQSHSQIQITSPSPVKVATQLNFKSPPSEGKISRNTSDDDSIMKLQLLQDTKEFLKQRVKELGFEERCTQRESQELNKEINVAKERSKKNNETMALLEEKYRDVGVVKSDNDMTINELNLHYKKALVDKESKVEELMKTNREHLKENQLLAGEAQKIKDDILKIREMCEELQGAFGKIEQFFNYSEKSIK